MHLFKDKAYIDNHGIRRMYRLIQEKRDWANSIILTILTICLSIGFAVPIQIKAAAPKPIAETIETYLEQLEDHNQDWQVRSAAAFELGRQQAESSVVIQALIDALDDPEPVVRLRSTFALIEIGQPAIPHLIGTLKHSSSKVQAKAEFALRKIGTPALSSLNNELNDAELDILINILNIFEQVGEDARDRPEKRTRAEIKPVIEQFEIAIVNIRNLLETKGKDSELDFGLPIGTVLNSKTVVLQETIGILQSELNGRLQGHIFRWLSLLLGALLFTVWLKPELMLKLSNILINLRQDRTTLDQSLSQVKRFFQASQATIQPLGNQGLKLRKIQGKLALYTPLPVLLLLRQPIDSDINNLAERVKTLAKQKATQVGILIYRETPNALFRMRIAEVRIRDGFIVIPIPFAAIEQALLEPGGAEGILAQYTDRYLPGANLFDDRNAIGDTLSFFGRSEILQRLEADLSRSQGIGLFGLRKSGKTSLLLQLGFAMRQHPVIHIDLQPYGGKQYSLFHKYEVQLYW
ncbi:MAG: HEAT repeat domain-containing protein [Spirulina sp. SIO3F2]|nr:HEAT repeat domain-containing protein [Spirulina sp. SIO3F2]